MTSLYIPLPMLEILLADRLSTSRSRSDARGAKFVILFAERSSLSRFIHSPIHPRSYIPKTQTPTAQKRKFDTGTTDYIYIKTKTIECSLPKLLSLRNKMDSKSNSPVRDFKSPGIILAHSVSAQQKRCKSLRACVKVVQEK